MYKCLYKYLPSLYLARIIFFNTLMTTTMNDDLTTTMNDELPNYETSSDDDDAVMIAEEAVVAPLTQEKPKKGHSNEARFINWDEVVIEDFDEDNGTVIGAKGLPWVKINSKDIQSMCIALKVGGYKNGKKNDWQSPSQEREPLNE